MAKPIISYQLFVDFRYYFFKRQPSYKHCHSLAIERSMSRLCPLWKWDLEKIVKRKSSKRIIRTKTIYVESKKDFEFRYQEASKRKAQAESICRMQNWNAMYNDNGIEF